ncbi:unnamed protein product [Mytilus coruscus]|uniref:Ig-like domain-containing protein n=1 Tax=Mytilus coruscus TaxID=42192 RepID=A0A6J8C5N1_MYTCO|nr:unnamed protein product [Mytilus coruscus]
MYEDEIRPDKRNIQGHCSESKCVKMGDLFEQLVVRICLTLNTVMFIICSNSLHIKFDVPSIIVYQKENLELNCQLAFNASVDDSVYYIKLSKNISGTYKDVVTVAYSSPAGINNSFLLVTWSDDNFKYRARVNESVIYPASEAKLKFIIPADNMTCGDGGSYQCLISYYTDNSFSETSYGTVDLSVESTTVKIATKNPLENYFLFSPGTVVDLYCNGTVGSPPAYFHWCYQRIGVDTRLIHYPGNIIQEPATKMECQYSRQSTLSYNITNESSAVVFQCKAELNNTCSPGRINAKYTLMISQGEGTDSTVKIEKGTHFPRVHDLKNGTRKTLATSYVCVHLKDFLDWVTFYN